MSFDFLNTALKASNTNPPPEAPAAGPERASVLGKVWQRVTHGVKSALGSLTNNALYSSLVSGGSFVAGKIFGESADIFSIANKDGSFSVENFARKTAFATGISTAAQFGLNAMITQPGGATPHTGHGPETYTPAPNVPVVPKPAQPVR